MQHTRTTLERSFHERSPAASDQALLVRVTHLEDEIERLEGARIRLQRAGRSSPRLNQTLRDLRRERASCLYALLD